MSVAHGGALNRAEVDRDLLKGMDRALTLRKYAGWRGGTVAGYKMRDLYIACCMKMQHVYWYDVVRGIDSLFQAMADAMERGETIRLQGFGSFDILERRARVISVAKHMEGLGPGLVQIDGRWFRVVGRHGQVRFRAGGDLAEATGTEKPHHNFTTWYETYGSGKGWQVEEDEDGRVWIVNRYGNTGGKKRIPNRKRAEQPERRILVTSPLYAGLRSKKGKKLRRGAMKVWE